MRSLSAIWNRRGCGKENKLASSGTAASDAAFGAEGTSWLNCWRLNQPSWILQRQLTRRLRHILGTNRLRRLTMIDRSRWLRQKLSDAKRCNKQWN